MACLISLTLLVLFLSFHITEGVDVVGLKFDETRSYIILSVFMLCVCAVKMIYVVAESWTRFIPESNLLLFIGLAIGFIIMKSNPNNTEFIDVLTIKSNRFFYIFLPPIILEASFAIYHKTFAANLIGVLLFAFVGTIANFLFIGFGLSIINAHDAIYTNLTTPLGLKTIWVFSALITAVDPVAVLAIFQEIHVDNNLYYLVFGESLLNDGVSIVLYDVMIKIDDYDNIGTIQILEAILIFHCVCLGGACIGLLISISTCIVTRFTYKVPLIEPIIVIFCGYLSYILADTLAWSGIISMITYGVLQAAYGFQNITQKSLILIKRLTKILAGVTESVIFLNLGVSVASRIGNIIDYMEFIVWSLFICMYARFLITLMLSALINHFHLNVRSLKWNQQFIIAYGGLRGGIAFSLAHLSGDNVIQGTTIITVLFTIFFMGFTMKPLVRLLNIEIAKPEELSLFYQINESVINHLLAAAEEIIGMKGRNALHEIFSSIDDLYIRPILQRDPMGREEKIMKTYEKLNMTMHMATTSTSGTQASEYYRNKLKPQLRNYVLEPRSRRESGMGNRTMSSIQSLVDPDTTRSTVDDLSTACNRAKNLPVIINSEFYFQNSINDMDIDQNKLAHKMSMMLYRKKQSLAVYGRRTPSIRVPIPKLRENESEVDMLTININKKSPSTIL